MRINIKVIPRASKNEVIKEKDQYKVRVTSPPVGGEANKTVIKLLAKELGVSKTCLQIVSGQISKNKVIEIVRRKK